MLAVAVLQGPEPDEYRYAPIQELLQHRLPLLFQLIVRDVLRQSGLDD
jgi:hypothetical protein